MSVLNPCGRCGGVVVIRQKWGTVKWVVFLLGLLAAPWCVGLILIPVALLMKNERFAECETCGSR